MLAMLLTLSSLGPVECLRKRSRSDRPIVARGRVIADFGEISFHAGLRC
jgi:hypothetical protein